MLTLAFPSLILWTIGIPAIVWFLMSENKKRLQNYEIKERYGFLYRGYRIDVYFWECITMYRKVVIALIAVFLKSLGSIIQSLSTLLFLVVFIIITANMKPFLSRKLNNLELISLISSNITIYCGVFYLTSV